MNFQSDELKNANEVTTLGQLPPVVFEIEKVKSDIRTALLLKGGSVLHNKFEEGFLKRSNCITGTSTLKDYLYLIKDDLCNKYKDDNKKNAATRKIFDNIFNSLDCLGLLEIDNDPNQVNALFLGFILRNFL